MLEGKKVRHRFFSDEEYLCIESDTLIDENGYVMRDFWKFRTSDDWDSGWEIFEPKVKN